MSTNITSVTEFLSVVNDENMTASQQIRYCDAPEEVWLELIALHPDLKADVVLNKKLPTKVLEALSCDSDSQIRWWTAMKRKLPPYVMNALSKDPEVSVRQRIAFNPSATSEVLLRLSCDTNEEVAAQARQRLSAGNFK